MSSVVQGATAILDVSRMLGGRGLKSVDNEYKNTKIKAAVKLYRAFSLTWPASMLIYWNKRKHLHEKRVQLPEDFLGTPTWPPFHCFGTPIWPP